MNHEAAEGNWWLSVPTLAICEWRLSDGNNCRFIERPLSPFIRFQCGLWAHKCWKNLPLSPSCEPFLNVRGRKCVSPSSQSTCFFDYGKVFSPSHPRFYIFRFFGFRVYMIKEIFASVRLSEVRKKKRGEQSKDSSSALHWAFNIWIVRQKEPSWSFLSFYFAILYWFWDLP